MPGPVLSAARRVAIVLALALLGAALCADAAGAAVSFVEASGSPFAAGGFISALAVADMNGDGHRDVVSAGPSGLAVLLGDGAGGFAAPVSYPGPTNGQEDSVAVADFNGDGRPDTAAVDGEIYYSSNKASVRLGTGGGALGAAQTVASGITYPEAVATADFNADGHPDLAFVGFPDPFVSDQEQLSVALGNGDGTFRSPTVLTLQTGASGSGSLAVGDINGDGKPDLVGARYDSEVVTAFLGNGDGTFGAAHSLTLTGDDGGRYYGLRTADVDGDGRAEILVAHAGPTSSSGGTPGGIFVLRSSATGTLSQVWEDTDVPAGQRGGSGIAVADYDGDGRPDLAVATGTPDMGSIAVFSGHGDGTFGARETFSDGQGQQLDPLATGDFNGDAKPDLVAGAGQLALLLDTPPVKPAVTFGDVEDVTKSSATVTGRVTANHEATSYHVEYGTTAAYGSSTPAVAPDSTLDNDYVTVGLSGLSPATTYHVRLVATSPAGTSYTADHTFTTIGPPTAVTLGASRIGTTNDMRVDGTVDPHGETTTWHLDYGPTTAYGSRSEETAAGGGQGPVSVAYPLTGLTPGATYHARIVATNADGTSAGDDVSFVAPGDSGTPPSSPQPPDQPPSQQPGPTPPQSGPTPPALTGTVSLTPGARLLTDGAFSADVTCSAACGAQLGSLVVDYAGAGRTGRTETYALDGDVANLAGGQAGTLQGSLPLAARGPIAEVLGHGGTVQLTLQVALTGAGGPATASDAKTVAVAGRAVSRRVRGVFSTPVVTIPDEHPEGVQYRYEVTISGRQTTNWDNNEDRADPTDPSCLLINHGTGRQTIDFASTPTPVVLAKDQFGIPAFFAAGGSVPFELPTPFDVDRTADVQVGVAGVCHGVASGGGSGAGPKGDCGRRSLSATTQLTAEPLLTGTERNYYTDPSYGGPYRQCDFYGPDAAQYDLDLLPTLVDGDLVDRLTGDSAPKPGESVTTTASRSFTRPLNGGSSRTLVVWKVTFKLLELPCPTGSRAGRVHTSVCVDQQSKKDAAETVRHQKEMLKFDEQSQATSCSPSMEGDDSPSGWSCAVLVGKVTYDNYVIAKAQEIVNDPPDKGYAHVAVPRPAKLPGLPKHAPAALRRLRSNQAQVVGLGAAVATAIDRASGARASGDLGALRRQDAAAKRYASRLAALVARQPRLEAAVAAALRKAGAVGRAVARRFGTPDEQAAASRLARSLRHFAAQRVHEKTTKQHAPAGPNWTGPTRR